MDDEIDLEDSSLNQTDDVPIDNESFMRFDLETTVLGMWNPSLKWMFF